jgi:WD40 repeat protein
MESFISHDSPYLVSMCEENFLKIVKFDDEKAYCINTIQVGGTLNRIHGFEDRLALVFQKGFFDVFEVDEQDSDYCLRNLEAPDHEDEILSFDYDSVSKLILTAGADNRIKVWTYYKILVYEVFLDEGLRQAIWFRNCEILLSHNLKILYFRNIGLEITPEEVE